MGILASQPFFRLVIDKGQIKQYLEQIASEPEHSEYSDDDASVVHNTVLDGPPRHHHHYTKRDDHLYSKHFALFWATQLSARHRYIFHAHPCFLCCHLYDRVRRSVTRLSM